MSAHQDRLARVALSRAVEPGDPRASAMVRQLGAQRALEELRRSAAAGEGDIAPRRLEAPPERDLERAEALGIEFLVPSDAAWPRGLDDLAHAVEVQGLGGVPVGLWVKGDVGVLTAGRCVAVVGSRSATAYGLDQASRLAADLSLGGRTVVSGAAFGIDRAAHVGVLSVEGPTVGVLAGGLDRPYPAGNADLVARIADSGALVSEVPHGMGPTRVRFLARNRIIAALSGGTVVVEAAIRSGALNTANWADQMSRPVMGVPGPVTSAASQGVHELLRRGAVLVSRSTHVLELVGVAGEGAVPEPRAPARASDQLDVRARHLLEAAGPDEAEPLATVADRAAMQVRHAALGLERLSRLGLVEEGPVGHWRRVEV